jgi:hypothetical protein
VNRRDILMGGLAAGAAAAVPTPALARDLSRAFEEAFGVPRTAATPPPPGLPVTIAPNPAYDARLLQIARRELQRAGKSVWRHDIVGIADFGRPSTLPRFHFVNLEAGTIKSFLVSHGRGSDPAHSGFLKAFSNVPGSEATSRGAYLTCEWYKGKYGTSVRLQGLDADNSNALERAIVMHPADYAREDYITRSGLAAAKAALPCRPRTSTKRCGTFRAGVCYLRTGSKSEPRPYNGLSSLITFSVDLRLPSHSARGAAKLAITGASRP